MRLIDEILRLFGTNRTRLRWRWDRMREASRRSARDLGGKTSRYEHKLCPGCGQPVGRTERSCVGCGAKLDSMPVYRARKALAGLLPEGFPVVTIALLVACGAVFLASWKASHDLAVAEALPARSTKILSWILYRYGAAESDAMVRGAEWWRLITATFLHGDALHLGMNGLGLWIAGQAVEEWFGRWRALLVFLVTGIGGHAISVAWDVSRGQGHFSVGASGAVFGLIGCMLGHALRWRGARGAAIRARFLPWAIYGILMGFAMPNVDNGAHIGGFLCGAALGAILKAR